MYKIRFKLKEIDQARMSEHNKKLPSKLSICTRSPSFLNLANKPYWG